MRLKSKDEKLNDIMAKVKCPLNAMRVEDGEVICTQPFSMYRKNIHKVSLGSIEEDIIEHCKGCKLKQIEEDKKKGNKITIKELALDDGQCVTCPTNGKKTFIVGDSGCQGCPFLNRSEMIKKAKENPKSPVKNIMCSYPSVSPDNLKVFLTPSAKKSLKKKEEVAKPDIG